MSARGLMELIIISPSIALPVFESLVRSQSFSRYDDI
jgi:hypothetical protein